MTLEGMRAKKGQYRRKPPNAQATAHVNEVAGSPKKVEAYELYVGVCVGSLKHVAQYLR